MFQPSVRFTVLALVVLFAQASLARVDQQFVPSYFGLIVNVGDSNRIDFAQTFTAGVTGRITRFDIWVERSPAVTLPLLYDVRRTQSGVPTEADVGANILASGFIEADWVPFFESPFGPADFLNIELDTPIAVTAGDVLALVLRSDDPYPDGCCDVAYGWYGSSPAQYERGAIFNRNSFGLRQWSTQGVMGADLAFRTYVIPEPSTLWYLVVVTMGVCTLLRLRRNPA